MVQTNISIFLWPELIKTSASNYMQIIVFVFNPLKFTATLFFLESEILSKGF